ncbi:MAG: ROK family protein [Nitrospiraceae bacterium]|nr:ROK family protein [Nitrospiraceae bacterium]
MARAVIGVDLGGTNLRTALLGPEGILFDKKKEDSHAAGGYEQVIRKLVDSINRQRKNAEQRGLAVAAVGVGAPGVIHAHRGIVVKSPNFPDWNNLPLKEELERPLGIPVFVENDANAAALGEQWLGAAKGINSMILLTLGTGVGGGIVLDGRIWQGADGMAGEVGHMTIFPEGRQCGCGNRGCLEMYASSRGIVLTYQERLAETGAASAGLTSEQIYERARSGDTVACDVMSRMGRSLGIGIANLINIFNPEMIVIGGGVKDAWQLFIAAAREEIAKRAFAFPAERAQIVPSALGDDAGMIGAAAIALQRTAQA